MTSGVSQKSNKPYARYRTTLIAAGGIYLFTQFAESESAKADQDGRPLHRFTAGQQVRIQVRPEYVKGVPVVQSIRGEVIVNAPKG